MLKIFNLNFIKNNFISKIQFDIHMNIYKKSLNNLNNYIFKKKIYFNSIFELIDILTDLPENEKFFFSNILGEYLNHDLYFKNFIFNKIKIFGNIKNMIIDNFGNFENFKNNFIKLIDNYIGWGWLVINNKKLFLLKTKENVNPLFPISLGGYNSFPLICIDNHEHSYFNDYKINNKNYLNTFFEFINWFEIENRLQNYILNY